MTRFQREQGIALVITLLVMTLLLIMGSAFLSISSTETLISTNERNRLQAFHLAEAGAERAMAELNINGGYAGTGGEQPLGFGTYTTTVSDLPPLPGIVDRKQIVSIGYIPNGTEPNPAMSRVQVVIERGSPFQVGLLAMGASSVNLEDNVVVDSYDSFQAPYDPETAGAYGHIHSNGGVTLLTNNTIQGNVTASGSVTLGDGSTITGAVTVGVPSVTVVTDITYPPLTSQATGISPPGAYDTTTHGLTVSAGETVTLDAGTYSFNEVSVGTGGRLDLTGPVLIYLTGRFYAQSGAVINTTANKPDNLMIISFYGIDQFETDPAIRMAEGTGQFFGSIYAPYGVVEIGNSGDLYTIGWEIYGAIVGDHIHIGDDARFHYDVALTRSSVPGGKFRPVSGMWREVFP